MLICDLSHLEILDHSSDIFGALQANDGILTLSLSEDNTLSLKQGSTELWSTKLANSPQGISLSLPGNPNLAVSSTTMATADGKSRTILALNFGTSPVVSFASARSLTASFPF
ncbi:MULTISPECIES: hypothetical protein [Leptolyngbya]|uniref:hypothetical protein n=1 Tax=Leptolyngbya TaxID=47251 RepID=UPI00168294E5|nr:hypothetical protein [Leptolyngbya sp. FACHB-1624]MBD1857604.1 hypothetical protein [Leptolyngbya sp. FACHB-1624]